MSMVVAGTRIHARVLADGPRPALVLHCGQGSGGMWRRVAERLDNRLRLVAPDFPGHGRSGPWPEGRDVHDVATEVARAHLLDGAHLIGHSFGATVALRLAIEEPGRIARLTLVEPVLFAAATGTPEAAEQDAADAPYRDACAARDWPLAARLFNRTWGGGTRWDDLRPETRARMAEAMPFVAASKPALHDDVHGLLAPGGPESLAMPVQLVRGADTQPVVAAIHRALLLRLPDADETVICGAGHMAPVTHPDAVAAVLAR